MTTDKPGSEATGALLDKAAIQALVAAGPVSRAAAEALAETRYWEQPAWTARDLATLQCEQSRLLMPMTVFHRAMEQALNRPVWLHEFARVERLRQELDGTVLPPSDPLAHALETLREVAPATPVVVVTPPAPERKEHADDANR